MGHGAWGMGMGHGHGYWVLGHGAWAWVLGTGYWVLGRRSWVVRQRTSVLGPAYLGAEIQFGTPAARGSGNGQHAASRYVLYNGVASPAQQSPLIFR